jgi:mitochondrial fission protein ELM1
VTKADLRLHADQQGVEPMMFDALARIRHDPSIIPDGNGGRPTRIWALLGNRPGDNAQVIALCDELGLPYERKQLSYNFLHILTGRFMGASRISLSQKAREEVIVGPWPDLIVAVGRRAVPIARWIREQTQGNTRIVLIGHPRVDPNLFDLVFTTRQYPVPKARPIRLLPIAMSPYRVPPQRTPEEQAYLDALPRPHLLFALGGKTRYWRLRPGLMAAKARALASRAESLGGTLITIGSRRTADEVLDAVEETLSGSRHVLLRESNPRFAVLMDDADEIYPTADSVSMISEAVATGKPVGMVDVAGTFLSRWLLGKDVASERNRRRDLRRFWRYLLSVGLIGTVEAPLSANVGNPAVEAAREVADLLAETYLF